MSVWQVGLLMWSVAGFAMATFADAAMRHEDGEGILFGHQTKTDAVIGLLVALFFFIAWPAVLIYCVVVAVRDGPIEEARAPLRRAPEPEPPAPSQWPNPSWMPPADHQELLCRMIRLRLKKDARLAGRGPPHRWPRASLWETPEAAVLETVRAYLTLHQDGMSPAAICRRIFDRLGGFEEGAAPAGLRALVRWRLQREDPPYLNLEPGVLGAATGLVMRFVRKEQADRLVAPEFPQPDWLCEPLTPSKIERDFEGLVYPGAGQSPDWQDRLAEKRREWTLLEMRVGPTDLIQRYEAPGGLGPRGLALVRGGRPIDYVSAIGEEPAAGSPMEEP